MKEIAASPMPEIPPYKLPLEFKDVSGKLGGGKNTNATKPAELDNGKTVNDTGASNSTANATAAKKPATDTNVAPIPPNTEAAPATTPAAA